jgi:hypothetical protein
MTIAQVNGHAYQPKSDHWDGSANKSQWTIQPAREYDIFALATSRSWMVDDSAWGIHLVNGKAEYLGRAAVDPGPADELFIAFFEIAPTCHGYPTRGKPGRRDHVPTAIRQQWLADEYVRPATLRKLGRGQSCRL